MTDKEKLVGLLDVIIQPGQKTLGEIADHLLANGVTFETDTNVGGKWISASKPPEEYRDECGELIPFLVCVDETEYPFRAMYDGKKWGDGIFEIPVKWWMPLPSTEGLYEP